MNALKLTNRVCRANSPPMTGTGRKVAAVMAMAGMVSLGGCINLEAPDEPIVIELNINITQEVIYRLAGPADQLIEENADIF